LQSGDTGGKLSDLIKGAIEDCQVTASEYNEILALAAEDGHIDAQEQQLLKQLNDLIANGTVKRIPG
jgi:hypothetical protein